MAGSCGRIGCGGEMFTRCHHHRSLLHREGPRHVHACAQLGNNTRRRGDATHLVLVLEPELVQGGVAGVVLDGAQVPGREELALAVKSVVCERGEDSVCGRGADEMHATHARTRRSRRCWS